MTHSSIFEVANIIRDFDPALASMFINRPFHRENIMIVFCDQMDKIIGTEKTGELVSLFYQAIHADRELYTAE